MKVLVRDFRELQCRLREDVSKEQNMDCTIISEDEHDNEKVPDVYAVTGNVGVLYNLWWATHPPEPIPPSKTCSIRIKSLPFKEKKNVELSIDERSRGTEIDVQAVE